MSITLDFTPTDIELIQAQATASNLSIEEFSRNIIIKTIHNAAYMAMIDQGLQQIAKGTCHHHELIEELP
ncbi:MAG: hypothetical protein IKH16_03155 [Selenomonadaceae bacterium]|nr:hypothetical protein [Selenomonadaceae bacterium]